MRQKLAFICFMSILFYSCDKNNIDGHWHIIETTDEEQVDDPSLNFYTFDISNQKGIANESSIFLRHYEISQDKENQELTIHTNSKPITLKYEMAPWIVDSKNHSDTDTLYLFSEEINTTYRGYRYKDGADYNHIYDPLNTRNYKQLKIPFFSDTLHIKTEDQTIRNSHLILFLNRENSSSSSFMIIDDLIAASDSIKDIKEEIQHFIGAINDQIIKVIIDGRLDSNEVKKILHALLEVGLEDSYIPIRIADKENIHWVKASTLLEFINKSENNNPNLKIWDAVDIQ